MKFSLIMKSAKKYSTGNNYPDAAIGFIKNNMPKGNIMASYDWGGYLIWHLPEKKVFIDGRMPSWRWDENPQNESASAMDDYIALFEGDLDMEKTFEKYDIDMLVFPRHQKRNMYIYLKEGFDRLVRLIRGEDKRDFYFLTELEKMGYKMVYRDAVTIIYKK